MGGRERVIGRKRRKGWMEGMRKKDGFMEEKLFSGKSAILVNSFLSIGEVRLYIMDILYVLDSVPVHKSQNILCFLFLLWFFISS